MSYGYLFSKKTSNNDYVDLPQTNFIKKRSSGLKVKGSFKLLIAEGNGNPSPPVESLNGVVIKLNTKCPDVIHNTWRVSDDNPNDQDIRGVVQ